MREGGVEGGKGGKGWIEGGIGREGKMEKKVKVRMVLGGKVYYSLFASHQLSG